MRKHYPLDPATGLENAALLPWADGVPATGVDGSYPPHVLCTDPEAEILNAQAAAGLANSNTDLTQLTQAMSIGIFLGTFGGTANALTAVIPVQMGALEVGMVFHGIIGVAANTGAATFNPTGFTLNPGVKPVVRKDGVSALANGDLGPGSLVSFRWDGAFYRVIGVTASDILAVLNANLKTVPQPIYPEITSAGNVIAVTSASATVVIGAGTWQHRGFNSYSTAQFASAPLTFTTLASKTYHLFWDAPGTGLATPAATYPIGLFTLLDMTATSPVETDPSYDSTYDHMMIARVVTNGGNVPTVTALVNRQSLSASLSDSPTGATDSISSGAIQPSYVASPRIIFDTRTPGNGGDGAGRAASRFTYNWARTPKIAPASANVGYTGLSGTPSVPYIYQEGGSQVTLKTVTRYQTDMNYQSDYNQAGIVNSAGTFILTGCFAKAYLDISANG